MGMSIDKAIDRLEDLHFEQDNWEYGELTEDCLLNREALRLATDTMRKYQRIQAIINNAKDSDGAVKYNWLYEQIGEVLEDGKIN